MVVPFLKLLSYFLLLTSFKLASSEVDIPVYYDHSCTIDKNFTSSSPYQFNLNTLLFSLYSNAAATDLPPEFYSTNTGAGTDAAYGEYMCRGDIPMEVCKNCVQDATSRITSECPNNKEAIIWYDQCLVRYSNSSFFSTLRQLPTVNSSLQVGPKRFRGFEGRSQLKLKTQTDSGHTGTNLSNAYRVLNKTVLEAAAAAATSSGTKKFATREANLSSSESVYTLVQCTPDLSPRFCSKCLYDMMERIPKENTSSEGRILNPSCNLRFARLRFYYKGNQPPSDYAFQEYGHPSRTAWNCSTSKAKDAYLNNLSSLFENISFSLNTTENKGFYRTIIRNKSDTFYGLFMCRGDVPLELCHECVNEGIQELNSTCSSSKEAIVWYDMCMLRYANRSFFSTLDTQPIYTQCGGIMLYNQKAGFNMLLANTLNDLVAVTPKSVGVRNFETEIVRNSSESKTLYTLAQCTPDLSSQDCRRCLAGALEHIKSGCLGNNGGQVMNPSCNLRFETYRFYNDSKSKTAISLPSTYPPTPEVDSLGNTVGSEGATLESLQFSLTAIEAATDKFSIENRIGKGGFGEVYMAT